jgi:uncharacterized protein YjbJ (UPF0337 family)
VPNVTDIRPDDGAEWSIGVSNQGGSKMSWDKFAGQWKEASGKAKQEWGMLTDHDLTLIDGKKDQLVGKIQEKYAISKEEAEKQVDEFMSAHPSTDEDGLQKL